MRAILSIKITPIGIVLILRKEDKVYIERVKNAEDILKGLDKILKKSKIENTNIRSIKVIDNLDKTGYTSYRIAKAIQKALKFSLELKQAQKLF